MNNSIVFSSARDPHDEIFIISESGNPGDEEKLTERDNLVAYEPSFSHDGEWVVFESHVLDVEDDGIIMKFRADGTGDYISLTNSDENGKQPNFSPVDDLIVYQKYNDGWDLWLINSDGTDDRRLTDNGFSTDASFSRDGKWIVYSQEDHEVDNANIYRISVNGSITERLTRFNGYDGAVSMYESLLAFESCEGDPDRSDGTTLWIRDISEPLIASISEVDDMTYLSSMFILPVIIIVKKMNIY